MVEDDLGSFPLDLHAHIGLPLSAPCKDLMDQQKKRKKRKKPTNNLTKHMRTEI